MPKKYVIILLICNMAQTVLIGKYILLNERCIAGFTKAVDVVKMDDQYFTEITKARP